MIVHLYYQLRILGGANVWSNFSYGSRVDNPNDWILNPQKSFLILFEKWKKSDGTKLKSILISSMQIIQENHQYLKKQDFMISTLR